eukprot:3710599-Alexandrium_andersonii.AAC.1
MRELLVDRPPGERKGAAKRACTVLGRQSSTDSHLIVLPQPIRFPATLLTVTMADRYRRNLLAPFSVHFSDTERLHMWQ